MYGTLKWVHIGAVTVSFCGFAARGLGSFAGAPWVRHRLARTLPHIVDTVLLLSAIGMLWAIHLSPWAVSWLLAKIIGLVIYIALGVVALRPVRGTAAIRPRAINLGAWISALVVFAYIVSVALTKTPMGALTWLRPPPTTP